MIETAIKKTFEDAFQKIKRISMDVKANQNTHKKQKSKEKEAPLERIILSNKKPDIFYYNPLASKLQYPKTSTDLNKDYQSGATINYAPSSQLQDGVLGFYHPATHSITLSSNLSSYAERFVLAHESAHAQGCYDEALTDARASSSIGYALRRFGQDSSFIH